MGHIKNK